MWFKKICTWIENAWNNFEYYVAAVAPEFKTKIIAFLGAIGNGAALMQGYLSGLPMGAYVTAENVIIANIVLFTLSYWLRGIGDRVEARGVPNA